jgi:hypothetical protein
MGGKNATNRRSSEIQRVHPRVIAAPIIELVAGHVIDSGVNIDDVLNRQVAKHPELFINKIKTLENSSYIWQQVDNQTVISPSMYNYIEFYYSEDNSMILEDQEPIDSHGVSPDISDIKLSIYKQKINKLIEERTVKQLNLWTGQNGKKKP